MVLFSLYDETTMTLDIRCYLTGSIKGMMISFLELETHDKKLAK